MLKTTVHRLYNITSAKAPALYRGTKDIFIADLDHQKSANSGVWGPGTYLSTDKSVATWYAFKNYDYFGICTEYKMPSGIKILVLKSGVDFKSSHPTGNDLMLLKAGAEKLEVKEKKIPQAQVSKIAKSLGYDAIQIDDASEPVNEPMVILVDPIKLSVVRYFYQSLEDEKPKEAKPSEAAAVDATLKKAKKAWDKKMKAYD